ncbi:MAG: UDP-N-acetylmuramoyl-L-alanyl-D-glutamate--2,6-diaminopimelate ligase [Planctomycetes bacterium]|nr:UDP-N-acetylmuramoyl-L-alanyl-D-glutamate--2,6-diaminopimelate ligase [Planctomycetota bacterium]
MLLSRLARTLSESCTLAPSVTTSGQPDPELRRACFDSRQVQKGDLYCALRGTRVDGRAYVADAVRRGAAAVLSIGGLDPAPSVPELRVQLGCEPAEVAGRAAALLVGRPSEELFIAALTGTNGKSTVVDLLQQAWLANGVAAARVGTLGFCWQGQERAGLNTTPCADEVHGFLAEVRDQGGRAVALEASSHGIVQHRLAGVEVDAVGWTNLSHDHLDYHGDMESYAAAKAQLVLGLPRGATAFLPADARVHAAVRGAVCDQAVFGLDDDDLPLHGSVALAEQGGLRLQVGGRYGSGVLESRLVGRHNAENLLLAFGLLRVSGIETERALAALAAAEGAPGRLQRVAPEFPARLFVDYAHTPEAITRALEALRASYPQARLGIVVGAGGDRDPVKRGPMGAAAAQGADWCLFTSDNPRTEDPEQILAAVVEGARQAPGSGELAAEVDRRAAIRQAVSRLEPGDVLLVAGKGHEPYQEIGGVRYDFDDRVELAEAVACLV